jgi:hypothetical protein
MGKSTPGPCDAPGGGNLVGIAGGCRHNLALEYDSLVQMSIDCPAADLTGDCLVDFSDFAVMASEWLN